MKNELKVERYDASEAAAKKKKILKIVSTGVGVAALSTMLGCYGLQQKATKTDTMTVNKDTVTVNKALDTIPVVEPIEEVVPTRQFYLGGNGAWFNSVIEFLEA